MIFPQIACGTLQTEQYEQVHVDKNRLLLYILNYETA